MVKVSLDGVTYVPNSVTIRINSCGVSQSKENSPDYHDDSNFS